MLIRAGALTIAVPRHDHVRLTGLRFDWLGEDRDGMLVAREVRDPNWHSDPGSTACPIPELKGR